jgi:hypothetical protein
MSNNKLFRNRKEFFTGDDVNREIDNYEGQVLVLVSTSLNEQNRTPQNQLFLADGGFGCDPTAMGSKIFGTFLSDEERCHMRRGQFHGVLKDEILKELGICPSCKMNLLHEDEVMNTLSRKDNETYICNPCGTKEAMEEMGL